jgi:cytochrome c peroxidase
MLLSLPCLLYLFHDTRIKADGTGGSNGCRMRFGPEAGWGANAGLATARAFLDPLKKQFPNLTHADL